MKTVLGQFYENNDKERAAKTAVARTMEGKVALENADGKDKKMMDEIVEKYPYEDLQILKADGAAEKMKFVKANHDAILNSRTIMEADDIAFLQSVTGRKISHDCYKFITDGNAEGVNFDLSDFKALSGIVKTQEEMDEDKKKINSICNAVNEYYKNHEMGKDSVEHVER